MYHVNSRLHKSRYQNVQLGNVYMVIVNLFAKEYAVKMANAKTIMLSVNLMIVTKVIVSRASVLAL